MTTPPAPIRTERLVLREPETRDRTQMIELLASEQVHKYLGGPQPFEEPQNGTLVIELGGTMIGLVKLSRREGRVELGYLLLPQAWGHGYAFEACKAVLEALPGATVVLRTQTANERSMRLAQKLGFTEVERYEAYGAEQWLGVRTSGRP
jgi:RimJ/RimL family protein N-acetyltransferase